MPATLTILTEAHLLAYAADELDTELRRSVEIAALEDERVAQRLAKMTGCRADTSHRTVAPARVN